MELVEIKKVKKGDFLRREIKGQPGERVYIKGDYDRASKSYSCTAFDDINSEIFIKSNKKVFIGFTF